MEVESSVNAYLQAQQRQAPPAVARYFAEFEDLHERKVWHQLTKAVEAFINIPEAAPYRIGVYNEFVRDWQKHMNKVKLVLFALAAARQLDSIPEAAAFMEKIAVDVNKPDSQEAYALASLEGAHF
ncbi:26S proteasome regulatory subunit, partial [Coemansia spiralis]